MKFGAIYKASQNLRLGLALHTKTYYSIDEDYYTSVRANYKTEIDGETSHSAKSTFNEYSYEYSNPYKIIFSGSYIFGQRALISADIEFIDYSSSDFSIEGDKSSYYDINSETENTYKGVFNFKLGGEYRLNSMISLRGGYAFIDSPYQSGFVNDNNQRNIFTGGLGFRHQNFFANFAYVNTQYSDSYVFYNFNDGVDPVMSALIEQKISKNDFMLSVGINF
jgi:long-subunit fatty acid transport protein